MVIEEASVKYLLTIIIVDIKSSWRHIVYCNIILKCFHVFLPFGAILGAILGVLGVSSDTKVVLRLVVTLKRYGIMRCNEIFTTKRHRKGE